MRKGEFNMFCRSCGNRLPAGAGFCNGCGANMAASGVRISEGIQAVFMRLGRRNSYILAGVVCLLVIAVIVSASGRPGAGTGLFGVGGAVSPEDEIQRTAARIDAAFSAGFDLSVIARGGGVDLGALRAYFDDHAYAVIAAVESMTNEAYAPLRHIEAIRTGAEVAGGVLGIVGGAVAGAVADDPFLDPENWARASVAGARITDITVGGSGDTAEATLRLTFTVDGSAFRGGVISAAASLAGLADFVGVNETWDVGVTMRRQADGVWIVERAFL